MSDIHRSSRGPKGRTGTGQAPRRRATTPSAHGAQRRHGGKGGRESGPATLLQLQITALGAQGDGLARLDDGTAVHVAGALPGETVSALVAGPRGQLQEIVTASADRTPPPCPHFGTCGGCAVQHLAEAPYLDWKAGLVRTALERVGIAAPVAAATPAWGEGRRRASLHARWQGSALQLGFARARSHELVEIDHCPVLSPALNDQLAQLRALAGALVPKDARASIAVTQTLGGLDVDITGAGAVARFGRSGFERLVTAAQGLARLSFEGEPAVTPGQPQVKVGTAVVDLPPGAFLQATQAGEDVLAARVVAWSQGAKRIADLFAGIGTFALRLKAIAPVLAVESDKAAVAALTRAANGLAGGHQLRAEARDLFRAPLAPLELKGVDTVVIDPPRAGAQAQCEQLARSPGVTRVVSVSCDPVSFARDAAILVAGGFRLTDLEAVDQFRFAPHVEIVARFQR